MDAVIVAVASAMINGRFFGSFNPPVAIFNTKTHTIEDENELKTRAIRCLTWLHLPRTALTIVRIV
jgi:hypothetical protein